MFSIRSSPISMSMKFSICRRQLFPVVSIVMSYFSKLILMLFPGKKKKVSLASIHLVEMVLTKYLHLFVTSVTISILFKFSKATYVTMAVSVVIATLFTVIKPHPLVTSTVTEQLKFPLESLWNSKLLCVSLSLLELYSELLWSY